MSHAENALTVVVTRKLPPTVESALSATYNVHLNDSDTPFTQSQVRDALVSSDVLLCTVTDRIDSSVFNGDIRTKLIANYGVGVNHIDLISARAAGVTVTNTPDVLTEDTADVAIALMLMTMRRLSEGELEARSASWNGWRPTHLMGRTLRGKTLGIIGYGRIGRAVARAAANAFGMRVVWYSPRDPAAHSEESAGPKSAERTNTIDELLHVSDVVSIHCPSTKETFHLIDEQRLLQMKQDAFLINTARGNVVDEQALVRALKAGTISGAGLDVYEDEPYIPDELRSLANVSLLPHMGSATVETRTAMGMRVLRNIDEFAGGKIPTDMVV